MFTPRQTARAAIDPSDIALNAEDAGRFLGLSPKTLANLRVNGAGPAFQKGNGRNGSVRYPKSSLTEWRAHRMKATTSDKGGPNVGR